MSAYVLIVGSLFLIRSFLTLSWLSSTEQTQTITFTRTEMGWRFVASMTMFLWAAALLYAEHT